MSLVRECARHLGFLGHQPGHGAQDLGAWACPGKGVWGVQVGK